MPKRALLMCKHQYTNTQIHKYTNTDICQGCFLDCDLAAARIDPVQIPVQSLGSANFSFTDCYMCTSKYMKLKLSLWSDYVKINQYANFSFTVCYMCTSKYIKLPYPVVQYLWCSYMTTSTEHYWNWNSKLKLPSRYNWMWYSSMFHEW